MYECLEIFRPMGLWLDNIYIDRLEYERIYR